MCGLIMQLPVQLNLEKTKKHFSSGQAQFCYNVYEIILSDELQLQYNTLKQKNTFSAD